MIHSDGLLVIEDIHNFGPYYSNTLRAWYKNFTTNWPKIRDNYEHHVNSRFKRMWEFYLIFCAAAFECRGLSLYQVVQSKRGIINQIAPGIVEGYDSVR
jgi:cyclopropane-fatty-acyl-phospholipid synthase